MFGSTFLLPFIAMVAGGAIGMTMGHTVGWFWGGVAGFGVGCAVLALIALIFALLERI